MSFPPTYEDDFDPEDFPWDSQEFENDGRDTDSYSGEAYSLDPNPLYRDDHPFWFDDPPCELQDSLQFGTVAIISEVLKRESKSINSMNNHDLTPLMTAIVMGTRLEVVQLLCRFGADTLIANSYGTTCLRLLDHYDTRVPSDIHEYLRGVIKTDYARLLRSNKITYTWQRLWRRLENMQRLKILQQTLLLSRRSVMDNQVMDLVAHELELMYLRDTHSNSEWVRAL